MRINDRIVRINDTFADCLTLKEAQLLIRLSGKQVRIYVQGLVFRMEPIKKNRKKLVCDLVTVMMMGQQKTSLL